MSPEQQLQAIRSLAAEFPSLQRNPEFLEFLHSQFEGEIVRSIWHDRMATEINDLKYPGIVMAEGSTVHSTEPEFYDGYFLGWKIMMETLRACPI